MQRSQRTVIQFGIILLLMFLLSGCSGVPSDLQSMFVNLESSYPNIWRLVTASAYVLGFLFAFKAVYQLKVYGEQRTMMSNSASIKGPLTYIIVSSALIFSPTVYQIVSATTFGYTSPSPLNLIQANDAQYQILEEAVLGLVQIMGVIAFIRGWVYIARTGEQSHQPGQFGKGLTHIVGGLLLVNIAGAWEVLKNTFGFS